MLSRFFRRFRHQPQQQARKQRAPFVEHLEGRQLMAVSPVVAGTKIKGVNLSSGGVSTNQTLITVPFTGNVKIADQSKIQLRGYAINPLTGKQRKMVINVVSANVLAADHRYLQITTDCLMRKGGAIMFLDGALIDDNGDTLAAQTVKAVKGQNKERFTLARRGFIVTDFTKFTPSLYSSATTPADASGTVAEATVTANLTTFLGKKVTLGIITASQRDAALARYNAAATKSIISDANLRAALVSLTGTAFESAIACYLDGQNATGKPYTIVTFQNPADASVPVAQSTLNTTTNRLSTVIKPQYKGEDFRALSAFLAHEALHQDSVNGLQEEIFAVTTEGLAYAEQAEVDPSFLANHTALVNFENERLMALLQSGRTIFPYVGLFTAPNHNSKNNVFPGSIPPSSGGSYTSYEDFIRRQYVARGAPDQVTAGNNILRSYYTAITTKTSAKSLAFTGSLLTDIDSFQNPIGTKAAIVLAGALRLGIV